MEKVKYRKTGSKHCRLRGGERPPPLHLDAMETQLLSHRAVSTPVLQLDLQRETHTHAAGLSWEWWQSLQVKETGQFSGVWSSLLWLLCLWFQLASSQVSFLLSMVLYQSPINLVHLYIIYFLDKPSLSLEWILLGGVSKCYSVLA